MTIESHLRIVPLLISYDESGDLIYFSEDDQYCRFAVIDGLGHGKSAHEASSRALDYLKETPYLEPGEAIREIHTLLKGTVGAVMAICILDKSSGRLLYSGIGNITTRSLTTQNMKIYPQDGIVGSILPTPQTHELMIAPGEILILYSDGIREYFDFLEIPGLQHESAKVITNTIIDRYSKRDDDASLLTVKVLA